MRKIFHNQSVNLCPSQTSQMYFIANWNFLIERRIYFIVHIWCRSKYQHMTYKNPHLNNCLMESWGIIYLLILLPKAMFFWVIDQFVLRAVLITVFSTKYYVCLNSLRPRQNRRRFADDIFKWMFLSENRGYLIEISLTFVPKGRINNKSALVRIMAWRRTGDKPLSWPMVCSLMTHIYVTGSQWV